MINRWNPNAIDPNRSFYKYSPAEESANLIKLVATLGDVLMHIDLHETTDSDETEFRPALAARDGIEYIEGMIQMAFTRWEIVKTLSLTSKKRSLSQLQK